MDLEQFVADSMESTMVLRYRALHPAARGVTASVECGMCGGVQPQRVRPGVRWVTIQCRGCGLTTRAPLPGSTLT